MDIKALMSGIAVVIDDAYENLGNAHSDADLIFGIVASIEEKLDIPFYKTGRLPEAGQEENILRAASFILLDWKLWPSTIGEDLEKEGIKENLEFLQKAKEYLVPVFIFTNESPEDVVDHLSKANLYEEESDGTGQNFIYIERKEDLGDPIAKIKNWIESNASVYVLKEWDAEFNRAKRNLFGSMYNKSPNWPKILWKTYERDGIEPGPQIAKLILDNLIGRMRLDIFDKELLDSEDTSPGKDGNTDLKSLMSEANFVPQAMLGDEVRAGDIFKDDEKYFLNIRPDCDCIPRGGSSSVGKIEIYCIEGASMEGADIEKKYNTEFGIFSERVTESIVFSIDGGKTICFKFRKFSIKKFLDMKDKRIGRLVHPYITNIQQRYAFYLQRQGLPRIPKEAVNSTDGEGSVKCSTKTEKGKK